MIQTLIWTVLFVVPGYLASAVKHFWLSTAARPVDRTIESIAWSFAAYLFCAVMPARIFELPSFSATVASAVNSPEKLMFTGDFLKSYAFIIMVGLVCSVAYMTLLASPLWARVLGRTPYARVWDEFWTKNRKTAASNGVWLDMNDGKQWAGYLKRASDTPGEREIWMTGVKGFDNGQLCDTPTTDMLVSASDISRVYILNHDLASWSRPAVEITELIAVEITELIEEVAPR